MSLACGPLATASLTGRDRWITDGGGGPIVLRTPSCGFLGCGLDSEGAAGLCQVHRSRCAWPTDCAMVSLDRLPQQAVFYGRRQRGALCGGGRDVATTMQYLLEISGAANRRRRRV